MIRPSILGISIILQSKILASWDHSVFGGGTKLRSFRQRDSFPTKLNRNRTDCSS